MNELIYFLIIIFLTCNIIVSGVLAVYVYKMSADLYVWRKEQWNEKKKQYKNVIDK